MIAIAFLPVFTLEAQEGRLFKPLAFTKNLAIAMSAVLAITLIPALMPLLVRGRILAEQRNPVSWLPRAPLRARCCVWPCACGGWCVLLAVGVRPDVPLPFQRLGSEFMPPLYEGKILYMPTTLPGLSVEAAKPARAGAWTARSKAFPRWSASLARPGALRLRPIPRRFSMMEMVVQLKPAAAVAAGLTYERPGRRDGQRRCRLPGVTNAWTMPIKARIDMLTTGVRTPVGIKIFGPTCKQIEEIGKHIEMVGAGRPWHPQRLCRARLGWLLPGLRHPDRDEIARYGLTVMDVGQIIESAIGGESIATTIEGRERYPINVRYPRELRDNPEKLQRVLVATPTGAQVPLAQLTTLRSCLARP